MDSNCSKPGRRSPARQPIHWRSDQPVILFITVCTRDQKPILAFPDVHDLLRTVWSGPSDWRVGQYVIMPEHLHFLCAPRSLDAELERWMRFWK